ncbi:MAG: hypothetical protein ACREXG_02615 [Polaromonas sp.]
MSDFVMQSPDTDSAIHRPCVAVAVVMRREHIDNRWQPWRWVPTSPRATRSLTTCW